MSSHVEKADTLMPLTAESPGFALRNFTESVQTLFFETKQTADVCLFRNATHILQNECVLEQALGFRFRAVDVFNLNKLQLYFYHTW